MQTTNQLKEKIQKANNDLAATEAEILTKREALESQADTDQSQQLAASLMVLEARARGFKRTIKDAEAEIARLAEFVESKEYKSGMKRIAELEAFFAKEADETNSTIFRLLEHLHKVDEKQREYSDLISRTCVDLTPTDKAFRERNKDWSYMMGVYHTLFRFNTQLGYAGILSRDHAQLTHRGI